MHVVDALAITGDEGRSSLRKAAGSWKGRKFREADALIDLFHRPQVALLLLFLGDSLGGHGYLGSSG